MNDCLFCKIVNNEIPSQKIFENEKILAFLDINPINPGHVLIVPKKHCNGLLDAGEENLNALIQPVPIIAKAIMSALDYEGFNLGVNNGSAAGQIVPHLHFHIMPRRAGDGHHLFHGAPYQLGEIEKVAEKIRQQLT
ncbi:HIT family protein [Candidatus Falkowbacteria bacterium]|nr:HIT family protein [Candidatus Falkowbacteria bacterium]